MVFSTLREWRHSPCLMTPFSATILFLLLILSCVGLIFQIPGLFIGLLLGPLTRRGNFLVEFLYPFGLARWGHLKILQWGGKAKNGVTLGAGKTSDLLLHSRCIEQRTEVVKGRVYIHPLPQFLDNIGYLIVCIPPNLRGMKKGPSDKKPKILGIIVDCGDAASVMADDGLPAWFTVMSGPKHRAWSLLKCLVVGAFYCYSSASCY